MRRSRFSHWRWIFGLSFSIALGLLLFVCTLLVREPAAPVIPVATPPPNWAADFPARIDQVTAALGQLAWPLPTPTEEPQGARALRWVRRCYELVLPAPAKPDAIERALEPVHAAAPGVTIQITHEAAGAHIQIGVDGLLTHTLNLHWLGRRPRAAILIDDLGNDLQIARAFASIDVPLTFAVMPFRPFSKQVAELAALFHREVVLHLPLEADSGEDFGANDVLRVSADRDETLHQLDASLATVPHAVGVNNHIGSRYTSDRVHMLWVLKGLRERHLFFLDSRTTPHSVACEVAAAVGAVCVERDVFLDDKDDEADIRVQLAAAMKLARTRGDVIAIGHARSATLTALEASVPSFATAGVDIVPLSVIVASRTTASPVVPNRALSAR